MFNLYFSKPILHFTMGHIAFSFIVEVVPYLFDCHEILNIANFIDAADVFAKVINVPCYGFE